MDYRYSDTEKAAQAVITAQEAAKEAQRRRDALTIADFGTGTGLFVGGLRVDTCYKDGDILYKTWRNRVKNPSFETEGTEQTLYENLFSNPQFKTPGDSVEVYRNEYSTPSFENAWSAQTLFQNSLVNPGVDDPGGTVEIRRNYFINPRMAGTGGMEYHTSTGVGAFATGLATYGTHYKHTRTTAGEAARVGIQFGTALSLGDVISLRLVIVASAATASFSVNYRPTTTTSSDNTSLGSYDLVAGVNEIVINAKTIPAAPTSGGGIALVWSTGAVDDTISVARVLVEKSPVAGPFFSGASSPDSDMTAGWVGTADASQSILTAQAANNISAYQCFAIRSQQWSSHGDYSVRLIANTTSNNTLVNIAGVSNGLTGYGVTFVPGATYTFSAVGRLAAALTGTLSSNTPRIRFVSEVEGYVYASSLLPNQAGEGKLSVTFTIPANATSARLQLYLGSSIGNGDIWYDDMMLVRASISPGYFDGSTPPAARRNLMPDPFLISGAAPIERYAGTGGSSTITNVNYGPAVSGRAAKEVVTVAATSGGDIGVKLSTSQGFKHGVRYTFVWTVMRVNGNVGGVSHGGAAGSTTVTIHEKSHSTTAAAAGVPVRMWATVSYNADNSSRIGCSISAPAAGEEVYFYDVVVYQGDHDSAKDDFLVEDEDYLMGWEGDENVSPSYLVDRDFTNVSWLGAEGASASVITGENASSNAGGNTPMISTRWAARGTRSQRIIWKSASTWSVPIGSMPDSSGVIYTVLMKVRSQSPVPSRFTIDRTTGASGVTVWQGTVDGETVVRGTYVGEAGSSARLSHYFQSGNPGQEVWIDEILVVKGAYQGDYFDGNTSPDPDLTASWEGVAGASQSILTGVRPAGFRQAWNGVVIMRSEGGIRVINLHRSDASRTVLQGLDVPDLLPNKTYTIAAMIINKTGLDLSGIRVLGTGWWAPYVSASMADGERKWVIGSVTTADTFAATYAAIGAEVQVPFGGEIIYENFMIFEGNYTKLGFFDGDAPPKLYRNLCWRPDPGAASNGYSGVVDIWDSGMEGGYSLAGVQDGVPSRFQSVSRPIYDLVVGRVYTAFITAVADNTPARIGFHFRVAENGGLSPATEYPIPEAQSTMSLTPTRYMFQFTATASVMHLGLKTSDSADPVDVSTWGIGGIVVLEGAHTEDPGYFSGDYSPSPFMASAWEGDANGSESYLHDVDFSSEWVGDAHESKSRIRIEGFKEGWVGSSRKVFHSTAWARNGSRSLRIIRTEGNASAAAGYQIAADFNSLEVGRVYTALGYVYIPDEYDASEDINYSSGVTSRGIYINGTSDRSQAPATPGLHLVRLKFTLASTTHSLRLGGGGLLGQSLWWDDVMLLEGDYTGEYWDGDKPPTLRRNLHPQTWNVSADSAEESTDYERSAINKVWKVTPAATNYSGLARSISIVEGKVYSASVWVYCPTAMTVNFALDGLSGAGSNVAVAAGVWTQLAQVAKVARGASTPFYVRAPVGSSPAFYVTEPVLEEGSVPGKFFTGDHYKAYWEGEPGASPSVRYDARYTIPSWEGDPHESVSRMWGANVDRGEPDIVPFTTPESAISALVNSDGTVFVSGPGVVSNRDGTITLDDNYVTVLPDGGIEF